MKHKTGFLLCLAVFVLTALVVVSLTLVFLERQDTTLLLNRIGDLKRENAELRVRLGLTMQTTSIARIQRGETRETAGPAGSMAPASVQADAENPLHSAVLAADAEALRTLIETGTDLTGTYGDSQALLHLAVQSGDAEVIALLAGAGLDVSAVDEQGRTPLHLAAETGHAAAAQQLIELGADLEAVDASGNTPLMSAVHAENSTLVEMLVIAGSKRQ